MLAAYACAVRLPCPAPEWSKFGEEALIPDLENLRGCRTPRIDESWLQQPNLLRSAAVSDHRESACNPDKTHTFLSYTPDLTYKRPEPG